MKEVCKEFQKIEDEFNERIGKFQEVYDKAKENRNVNLGGGKSFFEELEKFKSEIKEKSEKLSAKTPEDINAETKIYLGGFEIGNEEIFENLKKPLFINGEIDFFSSEKLTKIPKNIIFNGEVDFNECMFLAKISENIIFNKTAYFNGCKSLTKISQNVVFNGDAYFRGCASLTKISKETTFNGNANFFTCTSLSDETIEQLKQMKSDDRIKGVLTLPDGTTIR